MAVEILNPKIDARDFEAFVKEFKKLMPDYTPEWKVPDTLEGEKDVGFALAKVFCRMLEAVTQRLNRVPARHFIAFLDTLGIRLLPPRSASAPITFYLSEGVKEHVLVPARTQVAAGDIVFETDKNILAAPAKLTALFCFDPGNDTIYQHSQTLSAGTSFVPFAEKEPRENKQEHILYLGHKDFFDIKSPIELVLEMTGSNCSQLEQAGWEYWGERITSQNEEEIKDLDWHEFDKNQIKFEDNALTLIKGNDDGIEEKEINREKSRWIRCKLETSKIDDFKDVEIETIKARIKQPGSTGGILPDMAFYNYIPLDLTGISESKVIYPFGARPLETDIFYMGSKEAFSKKDAKITVVFTTDEAAGDPILSWEYWNGNGWNVIPGLKGFDGTTPPSDSTSFIDFKFVETGGVTFTCPKDVAPVKVNGQENYWIRSRIVNGDYGKGLKFDPNEGEYGKWVTDTINPPKINGISINYELPASSLEYKIAYNNLDYSYFKETPNKPFFTLEDENRSLYLGFDQKMEKGPISIFFSINEENLTKDRIPKIKWYYSIGENQWSLLEVDDNTQSLTTNNTVEFLMPLDFAKVRYFKEELYWIRAEDVNSEVEDLLEIRGIYINTVLATQAETIQDELLGSSDGSAGQEFKFKKDQVMEELVWIDETQTLTNEEKEKIIKEKGKDFILEEKDETGKVTRVWVRWQPVPDFQGSGDRDRHYIIDGAAGQITFSNSVQGMAPLPGRNNIKASYRTGGGQKGNVGANEIAELKTALPFVDKAFNHIPAEGGADTEQIHEIFRRAPHLIKHRNRAVSREDFQRLALGASSYIARTKCIVTGNQLNIIVIPKGEQDKPIPSPRLLKTVEKYIRQRCLTSLVTGTMAIQPPIYDEINVTVDVVPTSPDIAVPLEKTIKKRLKEFFHPLTGGPEKNGWEFGRDVHISDVYAMLESIEGVDHVETLKLNGQEQDVPVEDLETVCSGKHDITMKFGG